MKAKLVTESLNEFLENSDELTDEQKRYEQENIWEPMGQDTIGGWDRGIGNYNIALAWAAAYKHREILDYLLDNDLVDRENEETRRAIEFASGGEDADPNMVRKMKRHGITRLYPGQGQRYSRYK